MKGEMDASEVNLGEASALFLPAVPKDKRPIAEGEINKFIRWYGPDKPLASIHGHQLENYAESINSGAANTLETLTYLRSFFAFAKKEGLTKTNLGVHLRVSKSTSRRGNERVAPLAPVAALTPEGHAALQNKLESLKGQRPHVAEALRLARA